MWKKIVSAVNEFYNWLLISSANPAQASLTFKGLLTALVPTAMAVFGFAHIGVSSDMVGSFINGVAMVVQDFLFLLAALMTLWGVTRKIISTF